MKVATFTLFATLAVSAIAGDDGHDGDHDDWWHDGDTIDSGGCKCSWQDPCFPSEASWKSLNASTHGRLIRTVPLASPCFPKTSPAPITCEYITANWNESALHASDPTSLDYPMWSDTDDNPTYPAQGPCTPFSKTCKVPSYPTYSVNASTALHVKTAVRFALKYNLRVAVKNTGHDLFGRSASSGGGGGVLGVWTHNMRGVVAHDDFVPWGAHGQGEGKAVTIAAGEQWLGVYEEVAKHGLVVVGGANPTVGSVGGYLQGGGHGYLSSRHGLGADNALEFTVVLASGEEVIANAYNHRSLFWALRGGGGGTFGIVLSATIRAYPMPQTTRHTIALISKTPDHNDFWDAVAYIHTHLPRLSDAGLQGYYVVVQFNNSLIFTWSFYLHNQPAHAPTADEIFAPIASYIRSTYPTTLVLSTQTTPYPTFLEAYKPNIYPEAVGVNPVLASRLIPRHALEDNAPAVKSALIKAFPPGPAGGIVGQLVAGGQVIKNAYLDTAVTPAWRTAYLNLIITNGWPDDTPESAVRAIRDFNTNVSVAALKELVGGDGGGAYLNEADAFDPQWKQTFWGANAPRLESVKRLYDPKGVFYCRLCIGSDWWEVKGGRLCRV